MASPLIETRPDTTLRIALGRIHNDIPEDETEPTGSLTFFVLNSGPRTAFDLTLSVEKALWMIPNMAEFSAEQTFIFDVLRPMSDVDRYSWTRFSPNVRNNSTPGQVTWEWNEIMPKVLWRFKFQFNVSFFEDAQDFTGEISISSNNSMYSSVSYTINANSPTNQEADFSALDDPIDPFGCRQSLTGWMQDTPIPVSRLNMPAYLATLNDLDSTPPEDPIRVFSHNIETGHLEPKQVRTVTRLESKRAIRISFQADQTFLSQNFCVRPDTLLYLERINALIEGNSIQLGYWIPVRMLWNGATIKGMDASGRSTTVLVNNIEEMEHEVSSTSIEPSVVSQSHSYVVGTLGNGGVLSHNAGRGQRCRVADAPDMLEAVSVMAMRLVAVDTSTTATPRYELRYRPPRVSPPPQIPSGRSVPILPADVPRTDENNVWLIYLYEEDTPAVVENARHAIAMGCPSILTYQPDMASQRRRLSINRVMPQADLLELTAVERRGPRGTIGQLDRDEYPPAVAAEGGGAAFVTYIEAGDNRRAGSLMQRQFRDYNIQPGESFRYAVIHENLSMIEYLGDLPIGEMQIEEMEVEEPQIERPQD